MSETLTDPDPLAAAAHQLAMQQLKEEARRLAWQFPNVSEAAKDLIEEAVRLVRDYPDRADGAQGKMYVAVMAAGLTQPPLVGVDQKRERLRLTQTGERWLKHRRLEVASGSLESPGPRDRGKPVEAGMTRSAG